MNSASQLWQVEVTAKSETHDARGRTMFAAGRRAGFSEITSVRATRLYQLFGALERAEVQRLGEQLFADPVTETVQVLNAPAWPAEGNAEIEVHLQPGVMDPVALSAESAARELLGADAAERLQTLRTAWRYEVVGVGDIERLSALAERVFANACIESVFLQLGARADDLPTALPTPPQASFEKRTISLGDLSDKDLATLSRQAHLFLSVEELHAIRDHFAKLQRDPTDIELETLAQTWSEHCVHKTLKASVHYKGLEFGPEGDDGERVEMTFGNLLRDTIAKATHSLAAKWCLSVFEDNAGIIEFDKEFGVAFKVETHNHPSAIEPYGGAATGIGGCIRDILGCGLGARPIANTDVFCVADPDFDEKRIPPGVLHPRRVLQGVVGGVRDYGNRMGIPTVAGGLWFDERYLANPLVFAGCVGVIARKHIAKKPNAKDRIVVIGGRTGRDGLGGATFSSAELTDVHADEFAHAVQIGNAIEEKKVLDALMRAQDDDGQCLYSCITDCGAGGLSSAVGEMACELGAIVDIDQAPLKYAGLRYNEIWLSEAQERMVLAVPEANIERLRTICHEEDVEFADIGMFTGDGELSIRYEGTEYGRIDVHFLHDGIPKRHFDAAWNGPASGKTVDEERRTRFSPPTTFDALPMLLGSRRACSRESIFRQYDHEVQGGSAIKPLVGPGEGPSDAAVVRPRLDIRRAVAIGKGFCPDWSDVDPFWMAVRAVDEAVRNVVSVGADPERIAILDNFCWGGVSTPEEMGTLVRACQGCHDAALAYATPFISGKDSLNNQFSLDPEVAKRLDLPAKIAIPGTLLISAIGIVPDVDKCVTADLKSAGNRLVAVRADLCHEGFLVASKLHSAVGQLIKSGCVAACHDTGEGGILAALAEMAIGGRRGLDVNIGHIADNDADAAATLFDEIITGYILELKPSADMNAVVAAGKFLDLGVVTDEQRVRVLRDGASVAEWTVEDLESAWRGGFQLS